MEGDTTSGVCFPAPIFVFMEVFMAKINGKIISEADDMSVADSLTSAGYVSGRIAVEYNEAILPREDYDKTIIASSDNVEIVEFMGGG